LAKSSTHDLRVRCDGRILRSPESVHCGVCIDNLSAKSLLLEIPTAGFLALLALVFLWHFTIYDLAILRVKDLITKWIGVFNYRHWFAELKKTYNIAYLNPEELYGYLKWECPNVHYPHRVANVATPALHAFYLIPVAWLPTLIWAPNFDLFVAVAIIMIPLSFAADISWERFETSLFMRHHTAVEEAVRSYPQRLNDTPHSSA
jgi:hypothetical protein